METSATTRSAGLDDVPGGPALQSRLPQRGPDQLLVDPVEVHSGLGAEAADHEGTHGSTPGW
jgi:hypothetical protein